MTIHSRAAHSRAARRAVTVAAVSCGGAFVAVLAAACGSQASPSASATSGGTTPSSSSPSATPSSSQPTAGGAPMIPASQCPSAALRVTVNKAEGNAAAGTSYVPIDFTNISGHSCVMDGYPGVSFVTADPGSQIGAPASRQTSFGPQTATLASGGTAHAWLGIADAGNFPTSVCKPVTAHWLKVYPPDQFAALYTKFTATVCSKKVTGGSTALTILPVRPGPGTPGTVP
jgi:Protein of unknown function (DUF4232)